MRTCQAATNSGVCRRSAKGFAVFETRWNSIHSILPHKWLCEEHGRKIDLSPETWQSVRADFAKRIGCPVSSILKIHAGISTLTEDEVMELIQLVGKDDVGYIPKLPSVDLVSMDELKALGVDVTIPPGVK